MHMFFLNNPGNPIFFFFFFVSWPTRRVRTRVWKPLVYKLDYMLQSLLTASANANSNTGVEQSLMHKWFLAL